MLVGTPTLAYGFNEFEAANVPGFKLLFSGDFEKALEFFNEQARSNPDSAEAHMGRACALRYLNRPEEASKEYKLALLLNPSPMVSKKCTEELKTLEAPKQTRHNEVPNTPATFGPNDVEKSMGDIMKQSEEKIKTIHKSSEHYANGIYKSSSAVHAKTLEDIRRQIDDMSINFRGRRISPPGLSEYQNELNARASARLSHARRDYEIRRKDAEARALGVKESAEGLQSQMLKKPSETSGIYLIPSGTNLYVRNYGHFDPVMPEPPEPLKATPLKLPELVQAEKKEQSESNHKKHKKHHSKDSGD